MALLAGCANEALAPSITQATIRLLNRHGVEVVVAPDAGCCGSLEHHLGREAGAFAKARANIDAWTREIEGEGLDAILITISGCGTTVKDYGFMLRTDPVYAARGRQGVGPGARHLGISGDARHRPAREAIQPHGRVPLRLLAAARPAGASGAEGPAGGLRLRGEGNSRSASVLRLGRHLQYPAAGHRRPAARPQDRQTSTRPRPDIIAAGNIGCIAQIASGTAIPVVHPVELIDWATGGPVPEQLKGRVDG